MRTPQLTPLSFSALALLFTGCASIPPKRIASATVDGLRSRTGILIPAASEDRSLDGRVRLPSGIDIKKPLTSDDAAAIALWNNPQFNADLAQLGMSRGDLIDAGQLRNPRLDMLFPLGLKPFELLLNLPIEAIWERPARVAAAEKAYAQLAQSLIQNGINTVQDAKIAHANLALARQREDILARASELRARISKINAGHRVQTGELTEAEGIATEVDSASADELWVRSKHDSLLAIERLRLSLGLVFEITAPQVQIQKVSIAEPAATATLVEKALSLRPDLRASEIGVMGAAKRADWESARIAQLSVLLNSKGVGGNGILTGPGLSLEIPIFHRNNGRRERADAEVELATRQYLTLKQRVAFEVREARELLIQAQEALTRIRTKALPLLEKTVRIAEREYKRRAASYLFVLEQTRSLVDAQLRAADAEAGVARAEAQLERAVGGKR